MLIDKHKAYGDSAFKPVRVFSKADALEQINVRIDDKISRLCKGNPNDQEDTVLDLIGYLILRLMHPVSNSPSPKIETLGTMFCGKCRFFRPLLDKDCILFTHSNEGLCMHEPVQIREDLEKAGTLTDPPRGVKAIKQPNTQCCMHYHGSDSDKAYKEIVEEYLLSCQSLKRLDHYCINCDYFKASDDLCTLFDIELFSPSIQWCQQHNITAPGQGKNLLHDATWEQLSGRMI